MKSKVYFCKDVTPEGVLELYKKLNKELIGRVAIKVHSGEEGNPNFLRPEFWKPVVDKDLIERMESRHGIHTLEAAEALGIGSREYELIGV